MTQINANCSGSPGASLVELVIDNGHRYDCTVTGSRLTVEIRNSEPSPFGAAMVVDGRQVARLTIPPPGSWEASLPPVSMDPPTITFAPPVPVIEKLSTSGRDFIQQGVRWIWKGSSDFRAYQWFLDGRDLTSLYQQRRAAGANILRVFGMYQGGIGSFVPAAYGSAYWDGWIPFLDDAASEGFQVEVTAFADCQNIDSLKNIDQQLAHWSRLGGVLAPVQNVVVELVNEYPQNGVDPGRFTSLPWLLCSRGSSLSDAPPYLPGWSYQTWHGRRDWPKVLFSSEDMWYVGEGYGPSGVNQYPVSPVVHDEPIGFAEQNQPGRRSNDPYVARVLGQSSAAFGAGATFHSDAGIQSELWGPQTELCAHAFLSALGA